MASESIREWLDNEVKAGYGAKFASAFEEVGVEDKSDLHDMDAALVAELERELSAADAKSLHIAKIKKAIEAIVAPASATRSKLEAAKAADSQMAETFENTAVAALRQKRETTSSKKYAAFLSHHKLACAMEARFLKTELERMLGAEIFLDSDDLKDLRKLGEHVVDSDVLILLQSSEVLLRPWCAPPRATPPRQFFSRVAMRFSRTSLGARAGASTKCTRPSRMTFPSSPSPSHRRTTISRTRESSCFISTPSSTRTTQARPRF